jgi:hypothetical protein
MMEGVKGFPEHPNQSLFYLQVPVGPYLLTNYVEVLLYAYERDRRNNDSIIKHSYIFYTWIGRYYHSPRVQSHKDIHRL